MGQDLCAQVLFVRPEAFRTFFALFHSLYYYISDAHVLQFWMQVIAVISQTTSCHQSHELVRMQTR